MSDDEIMEGFGFDALIEALTIFRKYGDLQGPTCCEHDTMYVQVDPEKVSAEDKDRLKVLGFIPSERVPECFLSFRFGSS